MNQNSTHDFFDSPQALELARELTLERIKIMPDNLRMAVGSLDLTKMDLAKHVQEQDEIGKQIMEMNIGFLRDLASGAVYTYAN